MNDTITGRALTRRTISRRRRIRHASAGWRSPTQLQRSAGIRILSVEARVVGGRTHAYAWARREARGVPVSRDAHAHAHAHAQHDGHDR